MDWEKSYRERDAPWDLGGPAPPLVGLLEGKTIERLGAGRVLVPGCGVGHDAFAWQEAGMEVVGLDISPSALAQARERYGDGVTWLEGDFLDDSLATHSPVDLLFEHTCFCAIDPSLRPLYVQSAVRWLVPGGRLVGIFFLDPPERNDGEPGPPYRTEMKELRQLFTKFFRIAAESSPDRSHPDRVGREVLIEMVRNS